MSNYANFLFDIRFYICWATNVLLKWWSVLCIIEYWNMLFNMLNGRWTEGSYIPFNKRQLVERHHQILFEYGIMWSDGNIQHGGCKEWSSCKKALLFLERSWIRIHKAATKFPQVALLFSICCSANVGPFIIEVSSATFLLNAYRFREEAYFSHLTRNLPRGFW